MANNPPVEISQRFHEMDCHQQQPARPAPPTKATSRLPEFEMAGFASSTN
jgi:hypothetical protein